MSIILNSLKKQKDLFDLFTRREEYNPRIIDNYDRFLHSFSENRDVFTPSVSKYLYKNGLNVKYPSNEEYAVCLTHDIDVLYYDLKNLLKEVYSNFQKRNIKRIHNVLISRLSKKLNPLWNFEEIIRLEKKYGAKSTFFFLSIGKNNLDYNYNIKKVKKELEYILKSGFEIGLHGSLIAYNNLKSMATEKLALEKAAGKEIAGYRNHYLKFKTPDTWEILSRTEIEYDTTFAYADCLGFRNGMCHPFRPYNLKTNKLLNILEIPLSVMDFTIDRYMNIKSSYIWPTIERLIRETKECKGVLTVLWHNSYMEGEYKNLYERILSYCRNQNAWITSGENIAKWWKENDYFGL